MDENTITPSQLWTNYTTHNCRKWLGFWTRWNPLTGDLLESFDCIRHIQLINDSRMKHQNTFIYQDGTSVDTGPRNGPWEYLKDRDCDKQGMIHPSSHKTGFEARAFFVDNGAGVWTVTRVKEDKIFFLEVFFPDKFKRLTTGVQYGVDGRAARISFIREDNRARPSLYWSKDTDLKEEFDFSGEFYGTEVTLTANLTQTTKADCHWNRDYWMKTNQEKGYTVLYLPDNVMMSFPVGIEPGRSFQVSTSCHYTEEDQNEIRQETVYFQNGVFSHFKQGVYFPVNK